MLSIPSTSVLRFDFDAAALGGLPTHAGLAWTDVGTLLVAGPDSPPGVDAAVFEAFDANDQLVVTVGPTLLGDMSTFGGTAEDRFFGARHDPGIAWIRITMLNSEDFEIDHLQYGIRVIPLPPAMVLLGLPLLLLGRIRARSPAVTPSR